MNKKPRKIIEQTNLIPYYYYFFAAHRQNSGRENRKSGALQKKIMMKNKNKINGEHV